MSTSLTHMNQTVTLFGCKLQKDIRAFFGAVAQRGAGKPSKGRTLVHAYLQRPKPLCGGFMNPAWLDALL